MKLNAAINAALLLLAMPLLYAKEASAWSDKHSVETETENKAAPANLFAKLGHWIDRIPKDLSPQPPKEHLRSLKKAPKGKGKGKGETQVMFGFTDLFFNQTALQNVFGKK
jgi:hypothetical protein